VLASSFDSADLQIIREIPSFYGSSPMFGHCAGDLFEIGDAPLRTVAHQ
jgi:hypothetical protein